MQNLKILIILFICITAQSHSNGQIKRIWLTHRTNEPSHIVLSWYSYEAGNSEVCYRVGNEKECRIIINEQKKLHHVEIPLTEKDVVYNYKVITGKEESKTYSFKGYPSSGKILRIAIVGNWGFAENPDLTQLLKDNPHLLMTLGDNIKNLHEHCGEENNSAPTLFQTIPFMPILGNHDKQIRPRGEKYPILPVYDINANSFRKFFELPDSEWKWYFNIPDFSIGFIALDLNHISDFGTTWQTCHDFHIGSEQMKWYNEILKKNTNKNTITLHNAKNQQMREIENGEWKRLFQMGTSVVTGYGYFSERANVRGFPYFNTSLKAGDQYPDKFSEFLEVTGGYILMKISKETIGIEMKSLQGELLDCYILK